jgi:hypothetical protein
VPHKQYHNFREDVSGHGRGLHQVEVADIRCVFRYPKVQLETLDRYPGIKCD